MGVTPFSLEEVNDILTEMKKDKGILMHIVVYLFPYICVCNCIRSVSTSKQTSI